MRPRRRKTEPEEAYHDRLRQHEEERVRLYRDYFRASGRQHRLDRAYEHMVDLLRLNQHYLDPCLSRPALCMDCVFSLSGFVHRRRPSLGIEAYQVLTEEQRDLLATMWLSKILQNEAKTYDK